MPLVGRGKEKIAIKWHFLHSYQTLQIFRHPYLQSKPLTADKLFLSQFLGLFLTALIETYLFFNRWSKVAVILAKCIKLHFVQLCKIWVKLDNIDYSLFCGLLIKCWCKKIQRLWKVRNKGFMIWLEFCTAIQNTMLISESKLQQSLLLKFYNKHQ